MRRTESAFECLLIPSLRARQKPRLGHYEHRLAQFDQHKMINFRWLLLYSQDRRYIRIPLLPNDIPIQTWYTGVSVPSICRHLRAVAPDDVWSSPGPPPMVPCAPNVTLKASNHAAAIEIEISFSSVWLINMIDINSKSLILSSQQ